MRGGGRRRAGCEGKGDITRMRGGGGRRADARAGAAPSRGCKLCAAQRRCLGRAAGGPLCWAAGGGGELGKKLGFGIYMPLCGSHSYTVKREREETFWRAKFAGAEFSGLGSRGFEFLTAITNRRD